MIYAFKGSGGCGISNKLQDRQTNLKAKRSQKATAVTLGEWIMVQSEST